MFRWVAESFSREAPGFTVAFALFWSLFVGFICAIVATGAARQVASASRPTTQGTITVSEPAPKRKTGGVWNLEYTYAVAGRQYIGRVYAYDPMPIQGMEEVARHMAAYPVGAVVIVYHDRDDPADCVLRPGLRGCTLWIALFLTPFVIIGLGMWAGLVRRSWPRPAFDPANLRQVRVTATGAIVVRPERITWFATFLTHLGMTAFLVSWALFFCGFGLGAAYWMFGGFLLDPPVVVPACIWGVVLVGCALGTRRTLRSAPVLTVDIVGGCSCLPRAASRAVELPFNAISSVSVSEQVCRERSRTFTRHQVVVVRKDGSTAFSLAEYDQRRDADALAGWLRQRVCV